MQLVLHNIPMIDINNLLKCEMVLYVAHNKLEVRELAEEIHTRKLLCCLVIGNLPVIAFFGLFLDLVLKLAHLIFLLEL